LKLARALAALGRVGSAVFADESPGKIDFLFAECFDCVGMLCGTDSSTLVLRVLWCLPRVDLARSRKPIVLSCRLRFVIWQDKLHKMRRALIVTPGALVYVEVYSNG
jgi:hypothetical protein